jgi:hypothetical protein
MKQLPFAISTLTFSFFLIARGRDSAGDDEVRSPKR